MTHMQLLTTTMCVLKTVFFMENTMSYVQQGHLILFERTAFQQVETGAR
jgi:hypothetical protein